MRRRSRRSPSCPTTNRAGSIGDAMRFFALRLHEVDMIKSNPQEIIANGTDWRFLNELKRELKASLGREYDREHRGHDPPLVRPARAHGVAHRQRPLYAVSAYAQAE